jgi:hypothetical protein
VPEGTPSGQATLAGGASLGKVVQPANNSMPTSGMPHEAADRLRESMARVCMSVFLNKTPIYQRKPVSAPVKSLGLRRIQSLQRQPQKAKKPTALPR